MGQWSNAKQHHQRKHSVIKERIQVIELEVIKDRIHVIESLVLSCNRAIRKHQIVIIRKSIEVIEVSIKSLKYIGKIKGEIARLNEILLPSIDDPQYIGKIEEIIAQLNEMHCNLEESYMSDDSKPIIVLFSDDLQPIVDLL